MRRFGLLAVFSVLALAAALTPTDRTTRAQAFCFQESGFCVGNPAFQQYFRLRGEVRTFGYPISREFTFLGFRVQFFQGHIMQLMPDGRVATMNLLQEGLMPATRVNGSVFPAPDGGLIADTPKVSDRNYAERIVEFTRRHAPNEWAGRPVRFFDTFLGTVGLATAFPGGGGNPALLPLLNLEIWGALTSRPQADPTNPDFVYQRYQRSIMHYRESCRCTERILLADWFKTVITGHGLPGDLAEDMARSPFIYQYSPGAPGWLARPAELAATDLTDAFTPDLPGFPSPPGVSPPPPPPPPTDAAPGVTIQLSDDRIDPGQSITVTVIGEDDRGIEWIEWEGRDTDDPELDPERRFDCGGRAPCANVWSVAPTRPGRHRLQARARDTAGQERQSDRAELRVREGPTPTPTPTPSPTPNPCAPRPNVAVATAPAGPGRLQVTVTAGTTAALPNNRLAALRFGAATNALIDVPGGQTGATGNFAVTLSAGTQQTTFVVRRATPGVATTVPFVVQDECGDWPSIVGGGPAAF